MDKTKVRKPKVNEPILKSLPLNINVKKYWVKKYNRIFINCGADEACRKFKQLKVALMSYLADAKRHEHISKYYRMTGFRVNGYLKYLFCVADAQPHFALDFVKLFSFNTKSTKTADEAAGQTWNRLKQIKVSDNIPCFLEYWLNLALRPGLAISLYDKIKDPKFQLVIETSLGHTTIYKVNYGYKLANHYTKDEWARYWSKWYSILRKGWKSPISDNLTKAVWPEVYKDYDTLAKESHTYVSDLADLISMHQSEDSPFTDEELDFIDDYLSDEIRDELTAVLWGMDSTIPGLFKHTTILSGTYVGHIHHIPKKGGGTDLRDIAVPNRHVQAALEPGARRLYHLLELFPNDATFDQNAFDDRIQNRVNNPNLYQGSVDLSKATDNLPRSWGEFIVRELQIAFHDDPESDQWKSLALFFTVASSKWEDNGYLSEWSHGQPLGSLPSFALLGLTHNLFIESLAFAQGFGWSPYCILGDDIVIFNRKLRKTYISVLQSRRIPLSLHKSYEGNLSEFAGKIFVKGSIPFYNSDHSVITWESLFDYQRSTGVRIPWGFLPSNVKHRFIRVVQNLLDEEQAVAKKKAPEIYQIIQECEILGRGSVVYSPNLPDNLYEYYFTERFTSEEDQLPDPLYSTGISIIAGHPVTLLSNRYANKHGYFLRYQPVKLPSWYKTKFRPCATDAMIRWASEALVKSEMTD